MSKDEVFLSTILVLMYDFQYLGSTETLWWTRSSKKKLIEKDMIL